MKDMLKGTYSTVIIILLTGFISASVSLGSPQDKALPKTAELVPTETVLLVEIDNFSQLTEQFKKTSLYGLYKDPAMAGFAEDIKTKCQQKVREQIAGNDIVKTIVDTNTWPDGRVAVAAVLYEHRADGPESPFLIITQWGEKTAKIKEAVEAEVKKAVQAGAHRRSEDYRGLAITTIEKISQSSSPIPGEDAGASNNNAAEPISFFFADDTFAVSDDIELLKFLKAQIDGVKGPTLAQGGDYSTTIKTIGPHHDIDAYVNIKQIVKKIISEDTNDRARTTVSNLGFDNLVCFGLSAGIARNPSTSWAIKGILKIDGAKKGICKALQLNTDAIKMPSFIPASAYSMAFFNLSIKQTYEEIYNMLYSFTPAAGMMQMPLLPPGPAGEPAVMLKQDVIDHLGSQIFVAQSSKKPFTTGQMPSESVVALAVDDRSAIEKSLSVWHSKVIAAANPDAKRELLGHTIYLVSMPGFPFLQPGMTPMQGPGPGTAAEKQMTTLAFTVTDDYLILGAESTVEQAIRTLAGGGADTVESLKWFATAKSAMPSVVGAASMQDSAASGEIFWWMMKQGSKTQGPTAAPSPLGLQFGPFAAGELANFELLPPFETVRKYFGSSFGYCLSREDGFYFEGQYLNPQSSK
ncbi:MAG: hypothetical protein JXB29_00685 [Sedimentisphaerales bacterium]|nr:hypothetical protein [Sedimentisphaerales bacterium]